MAFNYIDFIRPRCLENINYYILVWLCVWKEIIWIKIFFFKKKGFFIFRFFYIYIIFSLCFVSTKEPKNLWTLHMVIHAKLKNYPFSNYFMTRCEARLNTKWSFLEILFLLIFFIKDIRKKGDFFTRFYISYLYHN